MPVRVQAPTERRGGRFRRSQPVPADGWCVRWPVLLHCCRSPRERSSDFLGSSSYQVLLSPILINNHIIPELAHWFDLLFSRAPGSIRIKFDISVIISLTVDALWCQQCLAPAPPHLSSIPGFPGFCPHQSCVCC